jgi:hypothetical protein
METVWKKAGKKVNTILKLSIFACFFLSLFIFLPKKVSAASLFVSPNSKTVTVGQSISANITVSSSDQAMNAVSGRISFPTDKLEVTSISKSGTIVSLWIKEPSFSNSEGVISFEGIVLNPGFVGSSGKVLGVTFKAKSTGTASLVFGSGSVLANDGQGTSILNGMGGSTFTINAAPPTPTPTPKEEIQENLKISKLSSSTHPDQDKWYTGNTAKFEWANPEGITGVSYTVDKNSGSEPGNKVESITSTYETKNIDDGIWYFHVKARNSKGWGPASHYRFQIDKSKPESITLHSDERKDLTEPKVKIKIDSVDKISGIDLYEIVIGSQKSIIWKDDGSHTFETPALSPGENQILIKALDKAGNYIVDYLKVIVEGLKAPTIANYFKQPKLGEDLLFEGKTEYPEERITVYIQTPEGEIKEFTGTSDKEGNFSISVKDLNIPGKFKAWIDVTDKRGAKSYPSEKVTFEIITPEGYKNQMYLKYGIIGILVITFLVLIFLLIKWISNKWHKRKHEASPLSEDADHLLGNLSVDLKDEIKLLEQAKDERELTPEEKKILFKLKKNKGNIQNFVNVDELIEKE